MVTLTELTELQSPSSTKWVINKILGHLNFHIYCYKVITLYVILICVISK